MNAEVLQLISGAEAEELQARYCELDAMEEFLKAQLKRLRTRKAAIQQKIFLSRSTDSQPSLNQHATTKSRVQKSF